MKKQTYAESQGREPFNWNAALADPPEKGSEEHIRMKNLSANWVTCACGNKCELIPRDKVGGPRDEDLWRYGSEFSGRVFAANWPEAITRLAAIEKRSAEIIAELGETNERGE